MRNILYGVIVLFAGSCVARAGNDIIYTSRSSWAASVSGVTTINFEGIAPASPYPIDFVLYGRVPGAFTTVGGVRFAVGPASSPGASLFVVGDGDYYPVAAITVQQGTGSTIDLLITLPNPVTALAFDFGDFGGQTETITLSDGTVQTVTTGLYPNLGFFGVTAPGGITSVDISEPALGGGNLQVTDFSYASASGSGAPSISVTPASINFGSASLSQTKTQRFIIENTGASGSTLAGTVMTPLPPFSITQGAGGFSLAAGASLQVDVQFQPSAMGPFSDSIAITSNDPTTPSFTVPLSGTGSDLSTVTVWIDAFIPYSTFGPASNLPQTLSIPGVTGVLSLIDIAGDGRSFSNQPNASYRVRWLQSFDVNTLMAGCPAPCAGTTGTSELLNALTGAVLASVTPPSGASVGQPQQVGSLVNVSMSGGATFGFLQPAQGILGGLIPAINANVTFIIDPINRTCQLLGAHGAFPAFEAYCQGNNDPAVPVWQHNVGPQIGWPIWIQGLYFPNGVLVAGTPVPF